jgi:hypothetical protein
MLRTEQFCSAHADNRRQRRTFLWLAKFDSQDHLFLVQTGFKVFRGIGRCRVANWLLAIRLEARLNWLQGITKTRIDPARIKTIG